MKLRNLVLWAGEELYAGNGMEYDTLEAAKDAADDLFSRWTAAKVIVTVPASCEPDATGRRGAAGPCFWTREKAEKEALYRKE